ncbi:MAG: glycosyltransferase family 4 protein, partial [Chromatiaceae bacterium]
IVECGDWDLVSCSFLTDLFGLEPKCPVAFHIYGLPPADMVAAEAPLLRSISAMSAVSGYVSEAFRARFGPERMPCTVAPLAPALSSQFLADKPRRSRKVEFACVGRLVPGKGVDTAINALGHLTRSRASRPTLMIAGTGPEEPLLRELCRDLGLADQVRFCGELDSVGLIALLDRVRWFLHPGRKPEAFGLAALEAMARGVPCLVSTPGGMREYLHDGKNGWEIAASEAYLFADRMQAVLDDPAREAEFRTQARATAAGFSRQRFDEAVNRFYRAALES